MTGSESLPEDLPAGSGFLERLLAFFIDAKLFLLAGGAVSMGLVRAELPEPAAGLLLIVLFLAFQTFLNSDLRQTPGKWIVGIRVVGADGLPLGRWKALGRGAAYFLSAAPFRLGFLWALVGRDRRAWHDWLSGSRVIEARPRGPVVRALIVGAAIAVIAFNAAAVGSYLEQRGMARAERLSN